MNATHKLANHIINSIRENPEKWTKYDDTYSDGFFTLKMNIFGYDLFKPEPVNFNIIDFIRLQFAISRMNAAKVLKLIDAGAEETAKNNPKDCQHNFVPKQPSDDVDYCVCIMCGQLIKIDVIGCNGLGL